MSNEKLERNELLELEILKQVEKSPRLNNRLVAAKLGCNIRLAHTLLKKLVNRGLLHVKKLHSRRWDYYLTPQGIAEKAKKTYRFFEFSMQWYQQARQLSEQTCKQIVANGHKTVAFIGAGSLAEIVYLGVQEWNLELKEVYGEGKKTFLGYQLLPYEDMQKYSADAIILCIFDLNNPVIKKYDMSKLRNVYWIYPETVKDHKI